MAYVFVQATETLKSCGAVVLLLLVAVVYVALAHDHDDPSTT